jgi:mannosyltransferase OCH1-like enzyme
MIYIPKIIHLSYISLDQIPEKWKDVLPTWKKTHPDWEIRFWSDEDNLELIQKNYPWFLDTYNNFKYKIQKCDAVRICYLHSFGGVYVDMDYLPIQNLNSLFENKNCDLFFTESPNIKCFTNSFLASKPHIDFWLNYLISIKNYQDKWYFTKHFTVMYSTGPLKLNELIKNYDSIIGYVPYHLIHKCNICNTNKGTCKINEQESYLKAIDGQSWNSFDTHLLNFFYCNYRTLLLMIILIFIFLKYSTIDSKKTRKRKIKR